jgi:hypothetical protein
MQQEEADDRQPDEPARRGGQLRCEGARRERHVALIR